MADLDQQLADAIAGGVAALVEAGQSLNGFGGFLRCEACGRCAPLDGLAVYLASGWPMCCGYTMRWWTRRQIDAGEVDGDG